MSKALLCGGLYGLMISGSLAIGWWMGGTSSSKSVKPIAEYQPIVECSDADGHRLPSVWRTDYNGYTFAVRVQPMEGQVWKECHVDFIRAKSVAVKEQ